MQTAPCCRSVNYKPQIGHGVTKLTFDEKTNTQTKTKCRFLLSINAKCEDKRNRLSRLITWLESIVTVGFFNPQNYRIIN